MKDQTSILIRLIYWEEPQEVGDLETISNHFLSLKEEKPTLELKTLVGDIHLVDLPILSGPGMDIKNLAIRKKYTTELCELKKQIEELLTLFTR